jgi:hypothetical protein
MTRGSGGPDREDLGTVMKSLSPELVYSRFAAAWPSLGITDESRRPEWSKTIIGWFRDQGKALGFDVYPDRGVKWQHPEYLNDLCWCVEEDWTPRTVMGAVYHGLVLVLESEWDQSWDEILDDFDKLLDVKAPLKVLICGPTRPQLEIFPERISGQIKAHMHQVPTERYLVLAFGPELISAWSFDHAGTYAALGTITYETGC